MPLVAFAILAAVPAAQDGGNPPAGTRGGVPESASSPFTPSVVHVNVAGNPTNVVPGTGGLPFNAGTSSASAFNRPYVSSNGAHWAIEVQIETATTADDEAYIVDGALFLREGDQAPWAPAGETVGSLDDELGLNDLGAVLIANNTEGTAPTTADDYIVLFSAPGVATVLAQEGSLVDLVIPAMAGGTWDDTMDLGGLSNGGAAAWRATGLDNTPGGTAADSAVAVLLGTSVLEGDVPLSQAGGATDTWQVFDTNDVFVGGGGLVGIQGDTSAATTIDDIFAVANVVVVQEGQIIPGSGFAEPVDDNGIIQCWVDPADNWYCRGNNDTTEQDWVLRNGTVVAKTGDEVEPGSGEHYSDATFSDCFFAMDGNASGAFLLGGVTDNPNADANGVLVYYDGFGGSFVVVREGDPVDLDGNGLIDDDAFFDTFGNDDAKLLADGSVLFVASLRNGAGTDIANGLFALEPVRAEVAKYGQACRRSIRFTRNVSGSYGVTAVPDAFDPVLGTSLGIVFDDEVSGPHALGFPFVFPGGTSTSSVDVDSNGRLLLPATDFSDFSPSVSELLGDLHPTIAPFWADFDINAVTGADILLKTGPGFATVTWAGIGQYDGSQPITVQATLRSDHSITVSYVGTALFEEGIGVGGQSPVLVGVSPGNGAADPGEIDLSLLPIAGGPVLYEFFTGVAEDLDLQLTLEPLTVPLIGGPTWDVRIDGIPQATIAAGLLLGFSNPGVDLGLVPGLGLGGCFLLTDGSAGSAPVPFAGSQSSVFAMPIPAAAWALAGVDVFVQAATISPGATPLGAALSNGVRGRIGF